MAGYVDIHAHLLPGIDDGPADLEQSLAMAQAAVDAGISTIASTPHLRPDFPNVHVEELAERCESMREAIKQAGIPLEVVSAAEASLVWAVEASDEELLLASYSQTGADLLIETPSTSAMTIETLLYDLRVKGYRVTLAHPERSPDFQDDDKRLLRLVDQGILLEINGGSLIGSDAGGRAKRLARRLVRNGIAHAIASDAHRGSSWRPVDRLGEGARIAAELVGRDRADWMTRTAPKAIIRGAAIPAAPPITDRPKLREWFRR